MRLSNERIKTLQALLKELCGLELTNEQTQEAGAAIMRFVIAKAQREQAVTKSKDYGSEPIEQS